MGSRLLGAVLVAGAVGCVAARPAILPGPPVDMHFALHDGATIISRAAEVRTQFLEFPKGKPISIHEEFRATTSETYEALPGGGFRVHTTLLEAVATRDGVIAPQDFSLVGVTLVSRVDAQGRFIALDNADDVIKGLRGRYTNSQVRQYVDNMLEPALRIPLQRAWTARFTTYCNKSVAPGTVLYSVDEQPVGDIGTVRTVERSRILGENVVNNRHVLDIDEEFVGRENLLARTPGAADALLPFADGVDTLTQNVHGDGRELIDPATCQTVSTEAQISGEGKLRDDFTRDTGVKLPLRVKYDVHRQVVRMTPAEAQAAGIPTTVQAAAAFASQAATN